MDLEPRMMLPDTLAREQKKMALAALVEELAKGKKKVKDPKFEKQHPRGAGGKFGKKVAGPSKEQIAARDYQPTDENDRWMGEWPNLEQSKIVKESHKDKDGRMVTIWSTEFQSPKDPSKTLRVSIRDQHDSAITSEGMKNALRTLQTVRTLYPELDTNKIIVQRRADVDKKFGPNSGWSILGYSNHNKLDVPGINKIGRDSIYLNGDMVGKFQKTAKIINTLVPKKWELGKNTSTEVSMHELGHQYQHQAGGKGSGARNLFNDPKIKKHLTPYGQTGSGEAYAESFRDWHVSKGKTKNPASIAYAKHEGWFGSNFKSKKKKKRGLISKIRHSLPFAVVEDTMDDGDYIIVEDINGAYIVGDPPVEEEPTQEDIDEAEAAAREAYEDLGLNYDE